MFKVEQRTKIKLNIYGKEYDIRKPTVKDAEFLSEMAAGQDDKERLDATVEFLDKMGLPADVSREMEIDHFKAMIEYVFGTVKKN